MEALYLVSNGVPWDVAMNADDAWREAMAIIFGELKGAKFDWSAMNFRELGA